jgi:Zn-dependent protease
MKWSWRIGTIAGISIQAHATFLILLAWIASSHLLLGHGWQAALSGSLFILAVFGIVVLHELGHALVARRFGIHTREITLLPIGGVARLERMPAEPRQELLIALAGPAVNILLAGLLLAVILFIEGAAALGDLALVGGGFMTRLMWVSVGIAVFNLIPAFPMDGGRVLRALLARSMDSLRATEIAASVGHAIALLFGFVGLFSNPLLVLIALFVWIGATEEAVMVRMRSALHGVPVTRAMISEFRKLAPGDSIGRAVEYILAGFQEDFPVVDDGELVGVLTQTDVLLGLSQRGPDATVDEFMHRQFSTVDPAEMADDVFARLQETGCHTLPVIRSGRLLGLVTMGNVGELLAVQAALRTNRARAAAGTEGSARNEDRSTRGLISSFAKNGNHRRVNSKSCEEGPLGSNH